MNSTSIQHSTLSLETYPCHGEDKEPPFIREFTPRGQPIYPYTSLEKISSEKEERIYKTVILENEFLKLTFIPEMNGRLYAAFDKVNKRDMFYNNPQLKPALFGLRGAWCANGVEYNFPNSHSTTTLEPIEFKAVKNQDGSASFICGDCELTSRMLWSVTVTLRPGSAAIEMQTRLYNPTHYPKRFYYWQNAAVPLFPETQFIYPESTQRLYTHPPMDISRLAYLDYPVHAGRDISLFKNIPQHFPVFAENMEEDFFGVYHHHLESGVVHVADHALVRGRKIWMFGNRRDGRIWIDLLTDSGVDYCEVQTGPFSLQSDYRLLQPGKMHIQNDIWMPVGKLGGFNAASESIAANIRQDKNTINIVFSAARDIPDATVILSKGSQVINKINLSLKPLKTEQLCMDYDGNNDYRIEIVDASGRELLSYTPRIEQKCSATTTHPPQKGDTYLEGSYWEQQGFPARAYGCYSSDSSAKSIISKARLDMDAGLIEKALKSLQALLCSHMDNAEALYYSALCYKKLGHYQKAEMQLSRCCDDALYKEDACCQLAEISLLQKQFALARKRLEHLLDEYTPSAYAAVLYTFTLRHTGGSSEQVKDAITYAETRHPFEPLIYGEKILSRDLIPTTLRGQILLEIVSRYMNLHATEDALRIIDAYLLDNDADVLPLIHYYKAFLCKKTIPDNLNTTWDFVFRNESEKVLLHALQKNPDDHAARYHLGNFYAAKQRWSDALECWQNVQDNHKSLARRNEALYWWQIEDNTNKAENCYEKALRADDCGAKTVWEYDHLLTAIGNNDKRTQLFDSHDTLVLNDKRLLLRKADAMIASGQAVAALDILDNHSFPLCEGKILPRLLFEDACWQLSEASLAAGNMEQALDYLQKPFTYPENLGVGKPAANMEAEWAWRCGKLYRQLGNEQNAIRFFKMGAKRGDAIPINFFPLKNVVWQHDPEMIELPFWQNLLFHAACFKELEMHSDYENITTRVAQLLDSRSQLKGHCEPEENILKHLLMSLNGYSNENSYDYPDSVPYRRLCQTAFN